MTELTTDPASVPAPPRDRQAGRNGTVETTLRFQRPLWASLSIPATMASIVALLILAGYTVNRPSSADFSKHPRTNPRLKPKTLCPCELCESRHSWKNRLSGNPPYPYHLLIPEEKAATGMV